MKNAILVSFLLGQIVTGCGDRFSATRTANPAVSNAAMTAELPQMEYVDLCDKNNDCRKFSRLVMGTDHLLHDNWTADGKPAMSEDEAFALLDEAARLGINFFDTSPIYAGNVENRLGKWLKSRKGLVLANGFFQNPAFNPDRQLYVLSKGGFPYDLHWTKKLDVGSHSPALEETLRGQGILKSDAHQPDGTRRLDHVPPGTYSSRLYGDASQIAKRVSEELSHTEGNLGAPATVYLMHRDDADFVGFKEVARPKTPVRTIMSALGDPALAQRFELVGWSNWHTERVDESVRLAQSDSSLPKPVLNSPYFSLFEMSHSSIHAGGVQVRHADMMNPEFQKGIKIMPYSPLGGFSILDKPEPRWQNAKKAAKEAHDRGDAYWKNVYPAIFTVDNEARFARVEAFTKAFNEARGTAFTVDQMINAYALAHARTDFLAVGPINVEQLRRTAQSLRLARMLTPDDLEFLHSGNRAPTSAPE